MSDPLAPFFANWLEETLWPLAAAAADLPPGTRLQEPQILGLLPFSGGSNTLDDCVLRAARDHCCRNPVFMAALLAARLAGTDQARQTRACIHALMWRDAVTLANVDELDYANNRQPELGFNSTSDRESLLQAEATWERWKKAAEPVRKALAELWEDIAYEIIWDDLPAE